LGGVLGKVGKAVLGAFDLAGSAGAGNVLNDADNAARGGTAVEGDATANGVVPGAGRTIPEELDPPPDNSNPWVPLNGYGEPTITINGLVPSSNVLTLQLPPSNAFDLALGDAGADNVLNGTGNAAGSGTTVADTAAINVPKGYLANADGTITGPRGGMYSPTSAFDGSGNPIFIDNTGNYYTFTSTGATRVVSPNPPSSIGVTGEIGEDALKLLGGQSQVMFQTSQGVRIVDQLAPGDIANEAKVGYTTLDASTALQVSKDAELLQTKAVNGVTWNFYTSPVTGQGGPSATLLKALTNAGIEVIVH